MYFSQMYQTLKQLVVSVIPKRFLFKHEIFFRSLFSFHLHGKKHLCIVCNNSSKKLVPIPDGDLLCTFCGSRSRTRRLHTFLTENKYLKGSVLHFSPSRSLYRQYKKNPELQYFSTDFEDEFIAEYQYDITNIPMADNSFDLIICYHILEHIKNDAKAMQELKRVLKPEGVCVIQTPFKEGEIYEDNTLTTPEQRLEAFGQEDHVRIYSINGLTERLSKNGFQNIQTHNFDSNVYLGFLPETIITAS